MKDIFMKYMIWEKLLVLNYFVHISKSAKGVHYDMYCQRHHGILSSHFPFSLRCRFLSQQYQSVFYANPLK